jgi:uncharacterized tellurite resistance protein B-like protein
VIKLLRSLLAPTPRRLDGEDAEIALAALLVRVARSDGHYDSAEQDRIDTILMQRHQASRPAIAALRHRAEVVEAEAPDTVRFTRALKAAVALEDRTGLIEALWSVALADDRRDPDEDRVLRLVTNLLGFTDVESAQARQRVMAR